MFAPFYLSNQQARLKSIRKKALFNAKKWSTIDQEASHSYKVMVKVIDQKLSAISVNK